MARCSRFAEYPKLYNLDAIVPLKRFRVIALDRGLVVHDSEYFTYLFPMHHFLAAFKQFKSILKPFNRPHYYLNLRETLKDQPGKSQTLDFVKSLAEVI